MGKHTQPWSEAPTTSWLRVGRKSRCDQRELFQGKALASRGWATETLPQQEPLPWDVPGAEHLISLLPHCSITAPYNYAIRNNTIKDGRRSWTDISPKNIYKWPPSSWEIQVKTTVREHMTFSRTTVTKMTYYSMEILVFETTGTILHFQQKS